MLQDIQLHLLRARSLLRAELGRDALKPFPGIAVYAGMPADALVIGGGQTALDVLVSPVRDGVREK